jgi:HEPN domain-containing protein
LSSLEGAQVAAVLARKATEDTVALRLLAGNSEIADGVIGFHAQQAVEKWLKAVMANRGLKEERIHDIGRLLQLLENDGTKLPPDSDLLDEFTVYAVPLRYNDLLDAEPLDREATVALIDEVGKWASAALAPSAA